MPKNLQKKHESARYVLNYNLGYDKYFSIILF